MGSSSETQSAVQTVANTFTQIHATMDRFTGVHEASIKMKELDFFFAPHDNHTGAKLAATLQVKREIAAKYNLPFDE